MLSIAFLYAIDTKEIAEELCSTLNQNEKNWNVKLYPTTTRGKDKDLWSAIETGRLAADIVFFIVSKEFVKENEVALKNLSILSNSKYRFARIVTGKNLWFPTSRIAPDFDISLDIPVEFKNEIWDDFVLGLCGYCNLVEMANQNSQQLKEERRNRSRNKTISILGVIGLYLSVISCACILLYTENAKWSQPYAEFTLLLVACLACAILLSILAFAVSNFNKKKEINSQREFSDDLDASLSKSASTQSKEPLFSAAIKSAMRVSDLYPGDLLDAFFSFSNYNRIAKKDKSAEANDLDDAEISRTIGENAYLPLGHLKLNWKQMKGYYDISKKQAKTSFNVAIFICFIGIIIFSFAIISPIIPGFNSIDSLIPIIGTIGGTVVELFAGTILLVYKKTLSQMNIYHEALAEYQRYLSCINLVSMISDAEQRNRLYDRMIYLEMDKNASLKIKPHKLTKIAHGTINKRDKRC